MKWCKEYMMWVNEIEANVGKDCPAKVFQGCEMCQNLEEIPTTTKKKKEKNKC